MNAELQPLELSNPAAWREHARDVLMSHCGRYTIVRYREGYGLPTTFTAFRRHGPPAEMRWAPPQIVGGGRDITEAFKACLEHAEREAAT